MIDRQDRLYKDERDSVMGRLASMETDPTFAESASQEPLSQRESARTEQLVRPRTPESIDEQLSRQYRSYKHEPLSGSLRSIHPRPTAGSSREEAQPSGRVLGSAASEEAARASSHFDYDGDQTPDAEVSPGVTEASPRPPLPLSHPSLQHIETLRRVTQRKPQDRLGSPENHPDTATSAAEEVSQVALMCWGRRGYLERVYLAHTSIFQGF